MPQSFVDHYELLQVSPNATSETIERVFRYFAKKYHPDIAGDEHRVQFKQMLEAYEVLRQPDTRARYDVEYQRQQKLNKELVSGAESAADDTRERYDLLSLFYAQRRRDYKQPGIGAGSLEMMVSIPPSVLQFHLWYFREKNWIQREESGQLSITAEGIDYVDSMNRPVSSGLHPRLEDRSRRLKNRRTATV